jgi:hypothetical protein
MGVVSIAVKAICQLAGTGNPYSYGDPADFGAIWALMEANAVPPRSGPIVIVADGIPPSNNGTSIDTASYLTPIDWAIGFTFSHLTLDSVRRPIYQGPDILILDLDAGTSTSFAARLVALFPGHKIQSMPWLRVFSLKGGDTDLALSNFTYTLLSDLREVGATREAPKSELERDAPPAGGFDIEVIRQLWISNLARPARAGDHHALANLVGPLLLLEQPIENVEPHTLALQRLLKALGVIPGSSEARLTPGSGRPWFNLSTAETDGARAILLDDMHHVGWGRFLCAALGLNERISDPGKVGWWESIGAKDSATLDVVTSLTAFLTHIESQLTDGLCRFDLDLRGTGEVCEVLFLDLRLFAGTAIEEEIAFFRRLLAIASRIAVLEQAPWERISSTEIAQLMQWINADPHREDDLYARAITLLPRILALLDPSLPVIVFSSTSRRDVSDALRSYGNLITCLRKPTLTIEHGLDLAESTRRNFAEAMEMAASLWQGRRACRRLAHEIRNNAGLAATWRSAPHRIKGGRHIEVYLDETGSAGTAGFTIGGVILAYPSYDAIRKVEADLENAGLCWYSSNDYPRDYLSKKPRRPNPVGHSRGANQHWKYASAIDHLRLVCKAHDVWLAAISVQSGVASDPGNRGHFPLEAAGAERHYLALLTALMELLFCEVLPEIVEPETREFVTLSIFPATRTIPINPFPGDGLRLLDSRENPKDYYGYEYFDFMDRFRTFDETSVVLPVAQLLDRRTDMASVLRVHHTRAVQLRYGEGFKLQPHWMLPVAQHYFADIALEKPGLFEEEYQKGFRVRLDGPVGASLRARQVMVAGNVTLGLRLVDGIRCNGDALAALLLSKFSAALATISGAMFLELCSDGRALIVATRVAWDGDEPLINWTTIAGTPCRLSNTVLEAHGIAPKAVRPGKILSAHLTTKKGSLAADQLRLVDAM